MLSKTLIVTGLISAISIIVIMTLSNPSQAGPTGILTLFICMYIVVMSATSFILLSASRLLSKFGVVRIQPLNMRRAYYYASVLALGPILFIGMQSVSSVGIYEIGLVLALLMLGCVYVARRLP